MFELPFFFVSCKTSPPIVIYKHFEFIEKNYGKSNNKNNRTCRWQDDYHRNRQTGQTGRWCGCGEWVKPWCWQQLFQQKKPKKMWILCHFQLITAKNFQLQGVSRRIFKTRRTSV
jgi:hypothetical protein